MEHFIIHIHSGRLQVLSSLLHYHCRVPQRKNCLSSYVNHDQLTTMLSIEKTTGKICYLLSARQLSITWGNSTLYWSWKPIQVEGAYSLPSEVWVEVWNQKSQSTVYIR
ncbi:hypothetical protein JHK84_054340 [Glycine max]|nr:hypothetical protein JHK85_055279 [Glycine max]KAG5084302.1 hypothetical protein JHK84_054340 [Glycine max]